MRKKKPIRKSTPEYDPKRQQNVLLEQISKDVKTIAEGHSVLDNKIDKIDSELVSVKQEMSQIKNVMEQRFNGVETAITEVDTTVKKVEGKLDTATTDHEHRIQKLEAVR